MTSIVPEAAPLSEVAATPPERSAAREMHHVGRQALIYGLSIILTRAVGFLMLPVYTRYLTPADYGVMELISMTLEIVSILAGAQIALGLFRYYHKAELPAEKNAVVSTAMLALGVSYGVVAAIGFVAAPWLSSLVFDSPGHAGLIRIASASLAFSSLSFVPFAYIRARERAMLFVAAQGVRLAIALALNILFIVGMGMGVRGFFTSALISNAVVGIWLTITVVRDVGIRFSPSVTRDLLRYGVPLMASWAAAFLSTYGGQFFLQNAGSSAAVGLYALAYQFGFLMSVVTYTPFMQGWDPKRFLIAQRADRDEIYAHAFLLLNVLVFSVSVGIVLFVDDMLRVMTTTPFWSAGALVPLILAAFILQAWAGMQDVGILLRERTEFVTLANWAGAAVALLLYWRLIPTMLGWGAAIATFSAFAVRFGIIYWASQRLVRVQYRWAPVLRLIVLSVLVWGLSQALPTQRLVVSVSVRTALFAAFLVGVWHLGVLSPEDRALARDTSRRVRARLQSTFGLRVAQRA